MDSTKMYVQVRYSNPIDHRVVSSDFGPSGPKVCIHRILCKRMGTISTRVPDDLEEELEEYLDEERLDRSTAVRKLLAEGLEEWRRERALERLADGDVSFSRAAEQAGMSVWELAQFVAEHDRSWVSSEHVERDLEDL